MLRILLPLLALLSILKGGHSSNFRSDVVIASERQLSDDCKCSQITCNYYKYNGEGNNYKPKNQSKECFEQCCENKKTSEKPTTTETTGTQERGCRCSTYSASECLSFCTGRSDEEDECLDECCDCSVTRVKDRESTLAPSLSPTACTCDDVTNDSCRQCTENEDFSSCCREECCMSTETTATKKWGEATSEKNNKWNNNKDNWGGGDKKPKPKPKPAPKPKGHPAAKKIGGKGKGKPHPKKATSSKPSGWSNGTDTTWGGDKPKWGWGGKESPDLMEVPSAAPSRAATRGEQAPVPLPVSSPTPKPTRISAKSDDREVCDCNDFTSGICFNCLTNSGNCPDRTCASECCEEVEQEACRCSDFTASSCNNCIGNGNGKCQDLDCAEQCCTSYEYTAEGNSHKNKDNNKGNKDDSNDAYGYAANGSSYKSKSIAQSEFSMNSSMKFGILSLVLGSILVAVVYSAFRSRRSAALDLSTPSLGADAAPADGAVAKIMTQRHQQVDDDGNVNFVQA